MSSLISVDSLSRLVDLIMNHCGDLNGAFPASEVALGWQGGGIALNGVPLPPSAAVPLQELMASHRIHTLHFSPLTRVVLGQALMAIQQEEGEGWRMRLEQLGVSCTWLLPSSSRDKLFAVRGNLVQVIDRPDRPQGDGEDQETPIAHPLLRASEVYTIEEVASKIITGIDQRQVLNTMGDLGPDARLLVYRQGDQVVRQEIFQDPRICKDINRGAVIENLKQVPADVSGWRVHEFYIDPKGCLGDECGRCAVACPENAIHLKGKGKGSFHEIDPLACKGCFICWVECVRIAADCIVVDGKTFDAEFRAKHFGE